MKTTSKNPMNDPSVRTVVDHACVSEKSIERYVVTQSRSRGLFCLKYSNPALAGFPDRIIVLPDAKVVWVELKSAGRRPTELQNIRIARLRDMGHRVEVIDSKDGVDRLLNDITSGHAI
ncbi:MAG: VRR-NUC domain-containing protein [Muribaculaceae bacterium]